MIIKLEKNINQKQLEVFIIRIRKEKSNIN